MAAPKEPPQVNIRPQNKDNVIPLENDNTDTNLNLDGIDEEKDPKIIQFPQTKVAADPEEETQTPELTQPLEVKPKEDTTEQEPEIEENEDDDEEVDSLNPSTDGLDYRDLERELDENKPTRKIKIFKRKSELEDFQVDFSDIFRIGSFVVQKYITGILREVNRGMERFTTYRRFVSDPIQRSFKGLGNLVTKTLQAPGIKQAATVVGAVYNTARTMNAGRKLIANSVGRSLGPTAAVALATGFNPAAIVISAGGLTALNVAAQIGELQWGALQEASLQRKLFGETFRNNPFFVEFRRIALAERYQAQVAAQAASIAAKQAELVAKLDQVLTKVSNIMLNTSISGQAAGSLMIRLSLETGMSKTRLIQMFEQIATQYNLPANRYRDIMSIIRRDKLLSATDELGDIAQKAPSGIKSALQSNFLTKIMQPIADIFNNGFSERLIRFTRYLNWGGWGGAVGAGIGLLLGNPVAGAIVGTGLGVGASVLRNKMPNVAGNLGLTKYLKMFSPALKFGLSFAAMVDSGNWAQRMLSELRKKGLADTWRNEMYGVNAIWNLVNAGFFGLNAVSLYGISSQIVSKYALAPALNLGSNIAGRLGFAGLSQGLSAGGASMAALGRNMTVGGIAGAALGVGITLLTGGGGLAVATALTGAAIGGAIGTAAGVIVTVTTGGFGSWTIPVFNFVGSFLGSLIGGIKGRYEESRISELGSTVMKMFGMLNLLNLFKDIDFNKPWNITTMLMLIFAFIQLSSIVGNEADSSATDTQIQNDNNTSSELNAPIQRLSYLYQYADPDSQLIFASTEITNQISLENLNFENEIAQLAYNKAATLEIGFWGKRNKQPTQNWDNQKYQEWSQCVNEKPQQITLCNQEIKFDYNTMYWSTSLVYDIYTEKGILNKEIQRSLSPHIMRQQFIEMNNYHKVKDLKKISQLKVGDVVYLSQGETDFVERVGLIVEISKDFIKTIEANSDKILNYYTINYNGRNLTATGNLSVIGYSSYEN